MLSYLNDEKLKKAMVKEMKLHKKQDQFIKGKYGVENGIFKGCSIGCAIHSLNRIKKISLPYEGHTHFESQLGIPEWLSRLNDNIFEGLPEGKNSDFSVEFLEAIPVGVDLNPVKWKFCAFILQQNIDRVLNLTISDDLKKQVVDSIRGALSLHETAIKTGLWDESAARSAESAARSAESAAWSAARSAEIAAWSAAWSAESAAGSAARRAESAARSAARSAESATSAAWSAESAARSAERSAADSAESAAWSAARSAEIAAWSAARSAADSAESAAYELYASKLLELLRSA